MTLIGAQNLILQLLAGQDIVTLGEIKVILSSTSKIKDEKLVTEIANLAIKEIESAAVIKRISESTFILNKPLAAYPQSIEINGNLAIEVARVLNEAAAMVTGKPDEELCNSMQVNEKDIETLVFIADEINKDRQKSGKFDEFYLPPNS